MRTAQDRNRMSDTLERDSEMLEDEEIPQEEIPEVRNKQAKRAKLIAQAQTQKLAAQKVRLVKRVLAQPASLSAPPKTQLKKQRKSERIQQTDQSELAVAVAKAVGNSLADAMQKAVQPLMHQLQPLMQQLQQQRIPTALQEQGMEEEYVPEGENDEEAELVKRHKKLTLEQAKLLSEDAKLRRDNATAITRLQLQLEEAQNAIKDRKDAISHEKAVSSESVSGHTIPDTKQDSEHRSDDSTKAKANKATAKLLKSMKLPPVKHYDDKSLQQGRDATTFLDDLRTYIECADLSLDSQEIEQRLPALVRLHIDGQVRVAWQAVESKWRQEMNLSPIAPIRKSWEDICTAFRDIVGQPAVTRQDALDILLVKGVYQRKDQDVVGYFTTFNQHLMWCTGALQPEAAVTLFVKGLREPLKAQCKVDPVTQKPYPTLSEVYLRAKNIQKSLQLSPNTQPSHVSQPPHVQKRGSDAKPSSGSKKPKVNTCRYCNKVPYTYAHAKVCPDNPANKGSGSGGGGGGSGAGGGANNVGEGGSKQDLPGPPRRPFGQKPAKK